MQSMSIKHGTRRCNLKRYAKRVLLNANFALFWAPKEAIEAPNWLQSTLNDDKPGLFII